MMTILVHIAETYEIEYHDDTIKQTIQDIIKENIDIRNDARKRRTHNEESCYVTFMW